MLQQMSPVDPRRQWISRQSPSDQWVDAAHTADLWAISVESLHDLRNVLQKQGKWSVEWRPNSVNLGASGRGCGVLFLRSDVVRVVTIRTRCRCTIRQAIRIYDAIAREGPL